MPRKLPPFVEAWRDRHGTLRVYFRRTKTSPRIPLPADPTSEAFAEAYRAALAGNLTAPKKRATARTVTPGTLAWLIRSYRKSAAYAGLRSTSKAGYESRMRLIEEAHGARTVSGMTRRGIEEKILGPYGDKPGQRLAILKMLRVLIRHAIAVGALRSDPSAGITRPKTKEIAAWSEAEIARFEDRWPLGSRERTAFALMLFTGQRRSDVHRMTWADLEGDQIRVVQQKTGARLLIPLHRDLRAALSAAPREHVAILTTAAGKPFTVAGFGNVFREAITAAGLPLRCQPHGLRKAAGRRLAEAGATAHEIMSVLGHRTLSEAERYTRDANQAALARSAIRKVEEPNGDKVPNPNRQTVGKIRKNGVHS